MKTKPISIRFDEQDLLLAQNLSGIKKPQKLVDLLIAEYVKPLKGATIELPKDYMNIKKIGVIKANGQVEELKFSKLKKDAYNGDKTSRFVLYEVGLTVPIEPNKQTEIETQIALYEAEIGTLGEGQWAAMAKNRLRDKIANLKKQLK